MFFNNVQDVVILFHLVFIYNLKYFCGFISGHPIFTTSRFGKPVIEMGNFRYNKYSRSTGPKAQWICNKWSSIYKCRASITTLDDVIIKHNNSHSHA